MAKAFSENVAEGDDIDIHEAICNDFDWVTDEQAEAMIHSGTVAAIAALENEGYEIKRSCDGVTQADREAAIPLFPPDIADEVRRGELDDSNIVKALVAHRVNSIKKDRL